MVAVTPSTPEIDTSSEFELVKLYVPSVLSSPSVKGSNENDASPNVLFGMVNAFKNVGAARLTRNDVVMLFAA
jgi:hypothetical protein